MDPVQPEPSILVIEDEESTRRMLRLLLSGMGYRVLLAPDGESGLAMFEAERPGLVLTDIKMPGMDGLEVLARIKRKWPKTEVVVATGHGDMELAVQALKLDASDFLTKPIRKDALEVSLNRAKERARVQDLLDSYTSELEARVRLATSELENTCRQLATLGEVNRSLGSLSGVTEIVDFLLEKLTAASPLAPEGLLIFDSELEGLSLWGGGSPLKLGEAWSQAVGGLDQPRTLEQLGLEAGELPCGSAGARFLILVPLVLDGKLNTGALLARSEAGPPDPEELATVQVMLSQAAGAISRAVRQEEELSFLQAQLEPQGGTEPIVGSHPRLQEVLKLVNAVARTDSTVLIVGESGTGKELVARRIHQLSTRGEAPFEVIHCAALPHTLLESELFGYEKGAFTGADHRKLGSFERAHGGTVFLDELAEIPPEAQVKLLRVLQFKEFKRLGGERPVRVDVRVVAATSSDLTQAMARGDFREDLYYRLNVVPVNLPPLRDRMADLPALAAHFLRKLSTRTGKTVDRISPAALRALQDYPWPGNVRELENALEHAMIVCQDGALRRRDLPDYLSGSNRRGAAKVSNLRDLEKEHLAEALERCGGNRVKAARLLGIGRSTLYRKMKEYGLN